MQPLLTSYRNRTILIFNNSFSTSVNIQANKFFKYPFLHFEVTSSTSAALVQAKRKIDKLME